MASALTTTRNLSGHVADNGSGTGAAMSCMHFNNSAKDAAISMYSFRPNSVRMKCVFGKIGIIGLLGNLIVIVVIFRFTNLAKKVTSMYIINQSLIDLVVAVPILLAAFIDIRFMLADDGALVQIYCRVWLTQTLQWGFIRSSTVNLMFLSIDRYIAVVHLIRHKTPFTRKKVFASLDDVLVKPTPLYGSTYCQHLRHHDKTLDRTPLLLRPNSAHISTSFPASETHGFYCLLSQAELSPNADVLGSAHNDLCHQGKSVTQTLSIVTCCYVICFSHHQLRLLVFRLSGIG